MTTTNDWLLNAYRKQGKANPVAKQEEREVETFRYSEAAEWSMNNYSAWK